MGVLYTPTEIDAVMERYEHTPTRELAEAIGSTVGRLNRLASLLQLRKSRECIAEVARRKIADPHHGGRRSQFQKGMTPVNKGKKMPPGWSPGRMRETQFKRGQRSGQSAALLMPIGVRRWIGSATGTQAKYLYEKVSDVMNVPYTVNWKAVHVLLWEKKRGPIPKGHALTFKDGNPANIKLRNLELLTRAQLMARNTIHNLPEDLKEVIRLKGSIKRVVTCRKRNAAKAEE
jgi:hypothetical protein